MAKTKRPPRSVGCATELALGYLGGKWKSVILARLKDRPLRYGELRRLIPHLSDKVLTERLRDLQSLGLIERVRGNAEKNAVAYRLTARGESLRPTLQALYDWGLATATDLNIEIRTE